MKTKLGKKLRYYRIQKGYNQENMAEILNISKKTYARIERGTTDIKLSMFLRVSEVLEEQPDSLIQKITL